MSYELMHAGYLIDGPNGTRFVGLNGEGKTEMIVERMMAEDNAAEAEDKIPYDRDDYTVSPIYMLGWRGSNRTFPTGGLEHTVANDILAGRQKAR